MKSEVARLLLRNRAIKAVLIVALASMPMTAAAGAASKNPLPSWNQGPAKQAIVAFVQSATDRSGTQYVPQDDRIAAFDNDGTLWAEQPLYFQGLFAFDRIKAMAPDHPEWREQMPFKALLENDMKAFAATGEKGLAEVMTTTHAGMTTDEFEKTVSDWISTAKHPRFNRPFTDLTHQPMLELLAYLRDNDGVRQQPCNTRK